MYRTSVSKYKTHFLLKHLKNKTFQPRFSRKRKENTSLSFSLMPINTSWINTDKLKLIVLYCCFKHTFYTFPAAIRHIFFNNIFKHQPAFHLKTQKKTRTCVSAPHRSDRSPPLKD